MTESEISSEDAPTEAAPQSDPIPDPTTGPSVAPDHLGEPLVVVSNVDKHFGRATCAARHQSHGAQG